MSLRSILKLLTKNLKLLDILVNQNNNWVIKLVIINYCGHNILLTIINWIIIHLNLILACKKRD